jgi:hypothetical protein
MHKNNLNDWEVFWFDRTVSLYIVLWTTVYALCKSDTWPTAVDRFGAQKRLVVIVASVKSFVFFNYS